MACCHSDSRLPAPRPPTSPESAHRRQADQMPSPLLVVVAYLHDRRLRYDTFVSFLWIYRTKSCDYVAARSALVALGFATQRRSALCKFIENATRMASSRFKGRRGRFEICASTCFGSHHPSSSTCDVDEPRSMLRITCETKQTAESESLVVT